MDMDITRKEENTYNVTTDTYYSYMEINVAKHGGTDPGSKRSLTHP